VGEIIIYAKQCPHDLLVLQGIGGKIQELPAIQPPLFTGKKETRKKTSSEVHL
jgi:hypothetical protein